MRQQALADSHLLHPLQQASLESLASAGPVESDPTTIKRLETEEAHRGAFTKAMDAARIDAVILPTGTQLPVVNGDRNTQLTTGRAETSLTFLASMMQWPSRTHPCTSLPAPASARFRRVQR